MLNIICNEERDKWNQIVKSFDNWDVYYLNEYAQSFQLHGDGEPFLIHYRDNFSEFCYVLMLSDVSRQAEMDGCLKENVYFDCSTPYGYGGPLCNETIPESSQREFLNDINEYALSKSIVSQFVRFHPLLSNHEASPCIFETRYLHDTVYISTTNPETIITNMDSKNRNMIRKAIKNGVKIECCPISDYRGFIPIYESTMKKDNAADYYYFSEEYFKSQVNLKDNACIFYALSDGRPIAASIMYYNDRFLHYHLAGVLTEYRGLAPSNLLLYEAACWASKKGIQKFHLGGGMTQDDSLFGFKKQFNRYGRIPFYIGRTVFNKKAYDELLRIRQERDPCFDPNNNYMIQYRLPK